ncbi:MAG: hypothetical protein HY819_00545 [Acidobacteria bacterium]|nr:hypothetical protein [Acidobacteriota bacterium]
MIRPRLIKVLLITLLLTFQLVFGQEKSNTPPLSVEFGVTLNDITKWAMPGSSMPSSMPGGMNSVSNVPGSGQAIDKQIQLNLVCKNTSSKPIKVIYWESRFLDIKNKPVVLEFKTEKKIDPGKEKKFDQDCKLDLTNLPVETLVGVRIVKIEFDKDKSTWETTTAQTDEAAYSSRTFRLKEQ